MASISSKRIGLSRKGSARELAHQQLREKLTAKGYFEHGRKKKLPAFCKRVAIVTSISGAAVRDMLQVLLTRWPLAEVVVCPVRVQGDGAAQDIATAIRQLNQLHHAGVVVVDAMIVGRGGGSAEDLWEFNAEVIADAVFDSRIPVISAIGHEIDVCICDHVADLHALTPTDAANKVVPHQAEVVQALRGLRNRMEDARAASLQPGKADAFGAGFACGLSPTFVADTRTGRASRRTFQAAAALDSAQSRACPKGNNGSGRPIADA